LVHLSTDYVFDGAGDRPYREDDPVCPLGVYAESKAAGEAHVRALASRHVILRTAWVFGAFGNNFAKAMLRLADLAPPGINVVDDQRGCPTAADAIAECILAILGKILADGFNGWGTYHFCGRPSVSRYQFAEAVLAGRAELRLNPVATADMPRRAPRPPYSELDCSRIKETFAIDQPDWRGGLDRMLQRIGGPSAAEPIP
jgi:dTDP-4-dehydrorhamnose reductase